MGSGLSRKYNAYLARNERKVLLVGLDNAGKTSIYLQLTEKTVRPTESTQNFEVASLKHGKFTFKLWDVGGQDKLRPYWRHYYTGAQGIMFVIDASDQARLDLAASELQNLCQDDLLADAAICVLLNKGDAPGALTEEQLKQRVNLEGICGSHPWRVQRSVATTGEGLQDAVQFLADNSKEI